MSKPKAILGVDVFGIQIALFDDFNACNEYLCGLGCESRDTDGSKGAARVDYDDKDRAFFSMILKPDATTETLVHECVHMADFIMDVLGIPTDAKNTEVRAYMAAHIYDQAFEALNE